jgi:hypothetical protein
MGIDRPDNPDVPPGNDGQQSDASAVETRYREEYYYALRTQVAQEARAQDRQQATEADTWAETADQARSMWGEYHRRWPPEERLPVDRSGDPPGSWRSDSNGYLDSSTNAQIEAECARIVEREQEKISPAMRDTENQDPTRHLIGFEHRRKSRDGIKEKVCATINDFNRSPEQAVSLVPDAIRYTFQYEEACYSQGVRLDIARLKDQGFILDMLKNSWSDDQYKGINSRWIEPGTDQRFEVQFHTRISFEAKQITHVAYERLRTRQPDLFEHMVLEAFQRKVADSVPVPPGATEILDYQERGKSAG